MERLSFQKSQMQMMSRPINFCSGPAALPAPVLQRMQAELPDFAGSGLSVMEHSHRDARIVGLFEETESLLKSLLGLGPEYRALFLPGGATLQFAQVPMNLLSPGGCGAYLTTGAWSEKAIKECSRYGEAVEVASSKASQYTEIPARADWHIPDSASYFHLCTNETIHGVEWFGSLADVNIPVVADMSSHLLSRQMPMHEFSLVYAGAQKNLGTAGVTIVLLREDLLLEPQSLTPSLMRYANQLANDSMVNTPPVFPVWVLNLVLEWVLECGGVAEMESRNQRKAEMLYTAIDQSGLYHNPVVTAARSWMNVPFVLHDATRDSAFLKQAQDHGLLNLKGHRSVGGMRASIYNAITEHDVQTLIDFMQEFERTSA